VAGPTPSVQEHLLVDDLRLYGPDADLYDRIYFRPELYEQAVAFVLAETRSGTPRILDLCAGTGSHAKLFAAAGARVLGVDRSPRMIAIARAKAPAARFVVGDARRVNVRGPFDAIVCLYGAVHYIRDQADVLALLEKCYGLLVPGGVIVFELRDSASVDGNPLCDERDGLGITTLWLRGRGIHGSDLYAVTAYDTRTGRQFLEVHNLFLTDPDLFVSLFRQAGFVSAGLRAGYTEQPYVPNQGSDVAVLVARRAPDA
jgi:SAM-dependent methyltransferase